MPSTDQIQLTEPLLDDLLDPSMTPPQICQSHNLNLTQLLDLIESDQYKQTIHTIERINTARQSTIHSNLQTQSLAVLRDIATGALTAVEEHPKRTASLLETARKATASLNKKSSTKPNAHPIEQSISSSGTISRGATHQLKPQEPTHGRSQRQHHHHDHPRDLHSTSRRRTQSRSHRTPLDQSPSLVLHLDRWHHPRPLHRIAITSLPKADNRSDLKRQIWLSSQAQKKAWEKRIASLPRPHAQDNFSSASVSTPGLHTRKPRNSRGYSISFKTIRSDSTGLDHARSTSPTRKLRPIKLSLIQRIKSNLKKPHLLGRIGISKLKPNLELLSALFRNPHHLSNTSVLALE